MAALVTLPVIDDDVKLRFAEAFVRTRNAAKAAIEVIPSNPGEAMRQAMLLPSDPFVIAEMERIKEDVPEASLLPSKCEIARQVLERANQPGVDNEEYEKLIKLYCSIMGHIERPGTNVDVSVQVAPVMVVRDHGTDEQWAAKTAEQQRNLVFDAAH